MTEAGRAAAAPDGALPEGSLGPPPEPIQPVDSFAAAGRKAMWVQVDRMLEREDLLRDPDETDALKRYRVATRRLRAALRVFRDAYPRRETKAIRAGLSDLARALGAVRDLDVRIEEVDRWATPDGDRGADAIRPLRASLVARRAAAAAVLARHIARKRHRQLLARLVQFVTAIDAERAGATGAAPERGVGDRTGSAVWAAYELVRAYEPIVRRADLATLHALRIEAKRLRYTVEFLGPLLGDEQEWILEKLVTLQDHLGALNDATLAVTTVRSFLDEHDATLSAPERAAVVAYLGDRERQLSELRRGVGRAWRPIVGAGFARRLASSLVPARRIAPIAPD